jgi:hypothetical protein
MSYVASVECHTSDVGGPALRAGGMVRTFPRGTVAGRRQPRLCRSVGETQVPWYTVLPPSIAFVAIGLVAILRAERSDIPTIVSALMRARVEKNQQDRASLPSESKPDPAGESANGDDGGQ